MKTIKAKAPKQSPITKKDQTGNRKAAKSPGEPRGDKYVNPGQEPISHPLGGKMAFREGVYGKGKA